MFSAHDIEILKIILGAVSALAGIVGVIWTIVWAIRGPKLNLSLLDTRGDLTRFGDSPQAPKAYFYHLRIVNNRKWTATNVRVKVTKISRSSGLGLQRLPVCLIWATHPGPKLYLMDVLGLDEEACNLGYISQEDCVFKLDAMDPARFAQSYKWPPNFEGFLSKGEKLWLELVAVGENARSNVLCLEIAWDGEWQDNPEEMQKHLVIKTITSRMAADYPGLRT